MAHHLTLASLLIMGALSAPLGKLYAQTMPPLPLPPTLEAAPEDNPALAQPKVAASPQTLTEAAQTSSEPVAVAAPNTPPSTPTDPNDPFNEKLVEGITYFNNNELEQRMNFAVEADHAPSQYIIGRMYTEGVAGLKIDYALASQWLAQAARKGYVPAMIELGRLYKFGGQNLAQDGALALEWFEKAAEKKSGAALLELGLLYENGIGVYQSLGKAYEYYNLAKDAGELEAFTKLGLMYQYGRGADYNLAKAIRYFNKVKNETTDPYVKESHSQALGEIYAGLAAEQQDPKISFQWMRRAAEEGQEVSFLALADAYRDGIGVQQDFVRAVAMYNRMAKEKQNIYAMRVLGFMYGNGFGVAKDYTKAHEWYLEAANLGDAEAAYQLGNLYFYGHGVKEDRTEAQKWFGRSQTLAQRSKSAKR